MSNANLHEHVVFGFAPTVAGVISLLGFLHLTWAAVGQQRTATKTVQDDSTYRAVATPDPALPTGWSTTSASDKGLAWSH